ncbi:MAG TPA: GNAT family N-acetyltransferase [Terriglobales bacterium]|jgi:ribosomal protein S18 acetylase RimI-like enzyme|nr:GNAT family N-acetyltransferase [Terriglobales bacterium]
MKARRLTAQQSVALLKVFCERHGAERIQAAYGWRQPPETMKASEKCWAFHDDNDAIVGWGSIFLDTRDADDDEAILVIGVFPASERQGWRVKILDWLVARAKKLGADRASMTVLKANEAHYARTIEDTKREDSGWTYAGDIWFPAPGHGYFVYPLQP